MSDLQRYSKMRGITKIKLDIQVFNFVNWLFSIVVFLECDFRGVFRNLSRRGLNIFFFFLGGGSAPVGAPNPLKTYRFYWPSEGRGTKPANNSPPSLLIRDLRISAKIYPDSCQSIIFSSKKIWFLRLPHSWSDKGFISTIANWTCPY